MKIKFFLIIFIYISISSKSQNYKIAEFDLNNDSIKEYVKWKFDHKLQFYLDLYTSIDSVKYEKIVKIPPHDFRATRLNYFEITNEIIASYPKLPQFLSTYIFKTQISKSLPLSLKWLLEVNNSKTFNTDNENVFSYYPVWSNEDLNKNNSCLILKDFDNISFKGFENIFIYYLGNTIWDENKKKIIKINKSISLLTDSSSVMIKKDSLYSWAYIEDSFFVGNNFSVKLKNKNSSIIQIGIWKDFLILSRYDNFGGSVLLINYNEGLGKVLNLPEKYLYQFKIEKNKLKVESKPDSMYEKKFYKEIKLKKFNYEND